MSTLVKEVTIPADRRINIELPLEVVPGEAVIRMTIEQKRPNQLGKRPLGFLKGHIRLNTDIAVYLY